MPVLNFKFSARVQTFKTLTKAGKLLQEPEKLFSFGRPNFTWLSIFVFESDLEELESEVDICSGAPPPPVKNNGFRYTPPEVCLFWPIEKGIAGFFLFV